MRRILPRVAPLARLVIAVVFLVAAGAKGADLFQFQRQIEIFLNGLGFEPSALWTHTATIVAVGVTGVELILGSMLITGFRSRFSLVTTLILLAVFSVVNLSALYIDPELMCGCFGALSHNSPGAALVEDIVLILITSTALFHQPEQSSGRRNGSLVITTLGIAWILFFFFQPAPWAVLREGMEWRQITTEPELPEVDSFMLWVFDPECLSCQDQVRILNRMSGEDRSIPLFGLASASPGRLWEFDMDFNPQFPILKTNTKVLDRLGILTGSLVEIENGKVKKIRRAYSLLTNGK